MNDRISQLPSHIIETILCLLPIRHAVRTSVLSKDWEHHWTKISKLEFTECEFQTLEFPIKPPIVEEKFNNVKRQRKGMTKRCNFFYAIYQVLLQHEGPIREFTLTMEADKTCAEIDRILHHLKKSNTVQKLTLRLFGSYRLPSSFYKLDRLTNLRLYSCHLDRQLADFNNFHNLTYLSLFNVTITSDMLLLLLSNCPILKNLEMFTKDIQGIGDFTITDLLEWFSMVEYLAIGFPILKCFVKGGGVTRVLPTPLIHLKYIYLADISFGLKCGLPILLLLIRSSPNLEKLSLEILNEEVWSSTFEEDDSNMRLGHLKELTIYGYNYRLPFLLLLMRSSPNLEKFTLQISEEPSLTLKKDCANMWLGHLKKLKIDDWRNEKYELDFMELILAKSPVLEKVTIETPIETSEDIDNDEELQFKETMLSSQRWQRAFPKHSLGSKMDVKGHMDRISNLPSSTIQKILTRMPMRDAFRTSILAQNWRGQCLNIPKLVFDDALFQEPAYKNTSVKYKLLYIVYPILLLHKGPIIALSLCISQLNSCCEIDQIIIHLSSIATLKKFELRIGSGDDHKLLPTFFKLQQLAVLTLENCAFQPPAAFNGFSKLVKLSFNNVSLTMKVFLQFISNCPLLKAVTLISDEKHLLGCWNSDFVELFACLPLVEYLCMSCYPIKCFATGVMPKKLPTPLVHLKCLQLLDLSFAKEVDLHSALLLVTSSPNIKKIIVEMLYNPNEAMSQTAMNLIDQQNYSNVILDHLQLITITNFTNMKTGMDFVKLILAKSPILKQVNVTIDRRVDIHEEVKMLKELLQYPRASTRAEINVKRP